MPNSHMNSRKNEFVHMTICLSVSVFAFSSSSQVGVSFHLMEHVIRSGVVDVFFMERSIIRWVPTTQMGESFLCCFLSRKDGNHTSFHVLATKGDNEVVVTRLYSSTEYGRPNNILPSFLDIL